MITLDTKTQLTLAAREFLINKTISAYGFLVIIQQELNTTFPINGPADRTNAQNFARQILAQVEPPPAPDENPTWEENGKWFYFDPLADPEFPFEIEITAIDIDSTQHILGERSPPATLSELHEYEVLMRTSGLRNGELRKSWADNPSPKPAPLWTGKPNAAEVFCKAIQVEVNESRVRRGHDPLPGNGWDD